MEQSDIKKYALAGLAVALGGGLLWYLSQDSVQLDPKIHTEAKMLSLMDELKLEYSCVYIRYLNKILKEKKLKPKPPASKTTELKKWEELHTAFHGELQGAIEQEKKDKLVAMGQRDPKIPLEIIEKWMYVNSNHKEIQSQRAMIEQLHEEVFEKNKVTVKGF